MAVVETKKAATGAMQSDQILDMNNTCFKKCICSSFNFNWGRAWWWQWAKTYRKDLGHTTSCDLNFSIPKMGKRATDHENRNESDQRPWKVLCPLYKAYSPPAHLTPMCISSILNCVLFGKCPNAPQEKVGGGGGGNMADQREILQWLLVSVSLPELVYTSGWNNTEKKVYNIPEHFTWWSWLSNMHTDSPITPDNVEKLLAAADQFNIMGIVRGCCEFPLPELCLDNCIGICKFTDYYYCPGAEAEGSHVHPAQLWGRWWKSRQSFCGALSHWT